MARMRFGIFTAPSHPAGENPTLLIDRDLELIARDRAVEASAAKYEAELKSKTTA